MKLSVIIPVYNEINTLSCVLGKVIKALPEITKEIVIVDDGSTDGTRQWLINLSQELEEKIIYFSPTTKQQELPRENISQFLNPYDNLTATLIKQNLIKLKVIFHRENQGKGAALRTGFHQATGDIFVIQDADLEYEPLDWQKMWKIIAEDRGDVVYGSRFYGEPHRVLYFHHYLGNQLISNLINLFCNTTLTDIEVCYKMFRREVLDGIKFTCNDFGFEVEFTVKITKSKRRWRIYETGISYYGRTYAEGKKIDWQDGVKALWYIFKFSFLVN
jgi:glycosyltransferase involved in cell wall biosynthesis